MTTPLFQSGRFTLHSGAVVPWKINCDALTDEDIATLALMIRECVPAFSGVEGVPRGGLRLAEALRAHVSLDAVRVLIVDDVLTTGASMDGQRAGRDCIGVVMFARGPVPKWVTALFTHHAHLEVW